MRKIFLSMVALVIAMTTMAAGSGTGWVKSFAPVEAKKNLGGIKTAVATDGSVYASSTYDQPFAFGEGTATDTEGLLAACVVKYDQKGAEKWVASFIGGDATVSAMTTDIDGNLYVAGSFLSASLKIVGATAENTKTVTGSEESITAFVAKFTADGEVTAATAVGSATDADIAASGLYFAMPEDVYVMPNDILVDGDKVYVTAAYTGDVADLSWEGRYLNVADFMYMDNKSMGVFSMAKADLTGMASEFNIGNTELLSENQHYAEAFKYIRYANKPIVAFIGFGNLTITDNSGNKKDLKFEVATDESGTKEHALMVAAFGLTFKLAAATHTQDAVPYNIAGASISADGTAYLGGTFANVFPFDNTQSATEATPFAAAISMTTGSVKWAKVAAGAGVAISTLLQGEAFAVTTGTSGYAFNTADGTAAEPEPFTEGTVKATDINELYNALAYIAADEADAKVYVCGPSNAVTPELEPISEATTWDFSKLTANTASANYNSSKEGILLTAETTPSITDEYLYSDYAGTDFTVSDETAFRSDAISFTGEYPIRKNRFAQNGVLKFKTTVDGTITVSFSDTGSSASATAVKRYLVVNGEQTEYWTSRENNGTEPYSAQLNVTSGKIAVAAGEVTISGSSAITVSKIIFTPASSAVKNIEAAVNVKNGVKKYVKNGKLVIETANGIFSVAGAQVK